MIMSMFVVFSPKISNLTRKIKAILFLSWPWKYEHITTNQVRLWLEQFVSGEVWYKGEYSLLESLHWFNLHLIQFYLMQMCLPNYLSTLYRLPGSYMPFIDLCRLSNISLSMQLYTCYLAHLNTMPYTDM